MGPATPSEIPKNYTCYRAKGRQAEQPRDWDREARGDCSRGHDGAECGGTRRWTLKGTDSPSLYNFSPTMPWPWTVPQDHVQVFSDQCSVRWASPIFSIPQPGPPHLHPPYLCVISSHCFYSAAFHSPPHPLRHWGLPHVFIVCTYLHSKLPNYVALLLLSPGLPQHLTRQACGVGAVPCMCIGSCSVHIYLGAVLCARS